MDLGNAVRWFRYASAFSKQCQSATKSLRRASCSKKQWPAGQSAVRNERKQKSRLWFTCLCPGTSTRGSASTGSSLSGLTDVIPHAAPAPFQLGQFIDCQVPLATCVQVEDECNIALNAVPVVVAVRDPNMCVHETIERLVYVQIFVPQCRLRDLQVSPCRTRVSLDYGRYEVDIKSGNGVIVVDYDN